MADQTRKPKPKKDEEQAKADEQAQAEATTSEVDDLLDEIDEVLESNSEEFVRSFIQKGGQALVPFYMSGTMAPRWVTALIIVVTGLVYWYREYRHSIG
jgi:ubiquitin-like protein Pup